MKRKAIAREELRLDAYNESSWLRDDDGDVVVEYVLCLTFDHTDGVAGVKPDGASAETIMCTLSIYCNEAAFCSNA